MNIQHLNFIKKSDYWQIRLIKDTRFLGSPDFKSSNLTKVSRLSKSVISTLLAFAEMMQ